MLEFFLFWHEHTYGDVCATYLLRHCSRFAPSHVSDIAYAASAHRCHKLLPGTAVATVLPKFYSQPGLNVDCWKPHVWRIKAGVWRSRTLIVSQARLDWLIDWLNSPEISRITGSSCSVSRTSQNCMWVQFTWPNPNGPVDVPDLCPSLERHSSMRR